MYILVCSTYVIMYCSLIVPDKKNFAGLHFTADWESRIFSSSSSSSSDSTTSWKQTYFSKGRHIKTCSFPSRTTKKGGLPPWTTLGLLTLKKHLFFGMFSLRCFRKQIVSFQATRQSDYAYICTHEPYCFDHYKYTYFLRVFPKMLQKQMCIIFSVHPSVSLCLCIYHYALNWLV